MSRVGAPSTDTFNGFGTPAAGLRVGAGGVGVGCSRRRRAHREKPGVVCSVVAYSVIALLAWLRKGHRCLSCACACRQGGRIVANGERRETIVRDGRKVVCSLLANAFPPPGSSRTSSTGSTSSSSGDRRSSQPARGRGRSSESIRAESANSESASSGCAPATTRKERGAVVDTRDGAQRKDGTGTGTGAGTSTGTDGV